MGKVSPSWGKYVKSLADKVFIEIKNLAPDYFPIEIVMSGSVNEKPRYVVIEGKKIPCGTKKTIKISYNASDKFGGKKPFYTDSEIIDWSTDLKDLETMLQARGKAVLGILDLENSGIDPEPTSETITGENAYTIKIWKGEKLTPEEWIANSLGRS
ncbi:MAG: hypothetical protein JSV39_01635 [Candidatus Aenigmatarchaeota archaeon]|nr:MAG: hypothetical protein JSV39_01635 [Candidatus Aenigmarchaeota archaeon]